MIIGIGVDLVDVHRVEGIIFRWEERFLKRLFTKHEISTCNNKKNPAQRFATRFAAKQAFIKALFPKGMDEDIDYREIEVDNSGDRPAVKMHGSIHARAEKSGVSKVHLMVSHDGNYAVANVILEGKA